MPSSLMAIVAPSLHLGYSDCVPLIERLINLVFANKLCFTAT